jgi:peptidoglycan/xylan/chitin deacetylase (PgdA/CDA1 family)
MSQHSNPPPRDLTGYGREPPHPRWPGDARIAVQFVINYEEGAENCILNGDAASQAFLSDIVGAVPWPGERHMNMESLYEYGARAGFWRLWRAFTNRGMPVTVFGVAKALAQAPEQVAAMKQANWEIAVMACDGSNMAISPRRTNAPIFRKQYESTPRSPASVRSDSIMAAARSTR